MLHTLVTCAPASFSEMFLERGVDLHARAPDGRSVLAAAIRAGNLDVAEVLRARGIEDDSTAMDRLIGLCLAASRTPHARWSPIAPTYCAMWPARTRMHSSARLRAGTSRSACCWACGFSPDAVGESGATALGQAAWRGQVPTVRLLLANGGCPAPLDDLYGETAVEWAHHGASHAQGAEAPCLEAAYLVGASPAT